MTVAEREYSAVVYHTRTGQVFRDLNLIQDPEWTAELNGAGGGQVVLPLGDTAVSERTTQLREWVPFKDRYSIAVLLGDTVMQAGPNRGYQPDEEPQDGQVGKVTVAFKGIWDLLNRRVLVNAAWDPSVAPLTNAVADITQTYSLHTIAREIVNHSINKSFILGSNLPIDLPAQIAGTDTRTYHGYEMISAGQRLQELTQVDQGPDVMFQPYLTVSGGSRYIRHRMLIGNPYLVAPGNPLQFDYRSTLAKIGVNGASDDVPTSAYVKGTGNETGQLYGYATNASLIAAGWPLVDLVDSSHTSASVQSTLDGWALADIALAATAPEQWKGTVLADTDPRVGEYQPGHFVTYNIQDHHWIPNGMYTRRLLSVGRSSGTPQGQVEHMVQAQNLGG